MANENKPQQGSTEKWLIRRLIEQYFYNKASTIWSRTFGKRLGQVSEITVEGKEQTNPIFQQYKSELFDKNMGMITTLKDIEERWTRIEEALFGSEEEKFEYQEKEYSHVIPDIYRKIEYFRDPELVDKEARLFKELGTIELVRERVYDEDKTRDFIGK